MVCTGYNRPFIFVLSKDMVHDALSQGKLSLSDPDQDSPEDSASGKVVVSRWRIDPNHRHVTVPKLSKSRVKRGKSAAQAGLVVPSLVPLQTPVSTRNVFREKFFSLFVETDIMAAPRPDSVHLVVGKEKDWVQRVIELPNLTPALENAMLAFCTARLGRSSLRNDLVHQSLALYSQGLSEMRRNVCNKAVQSSDQTIASCLALLLYEVTECPGGTIDGYMAHHQAVMHMMEARGPAAHASGLSFRVFQSVRFHAVSAGWLIMIPAVLCTLCQ